MERQRLIDRYAALGGSADTAAKLTDAELAFALLATTTPNENRPRGGFDTADLDGQ
jgi:hypothetical protein